MENLIIECPTGQYDVPNINFNYKSGICEISGESYPENSPGFYDPVIEWLSKYMFEEKKPIQINFRLYYFNTSSSKSLYDLLMLLKKYQDAGGSITINWYCEAWDVDLLEEIEDFNISTGLKINIIKYEK